MENSLKDQLFKNKLTLSKLFLTLRVSGLIINFNKVFGQCIYSILKSNI
jgi:hypothetical protein